MLYRWYVFKISRLTDYGVIILRYLADKNGELRPISAKDISLSSGLPEPTVKKILKKMAKEGLIQAKRGSLGGYELIRDPKTISLLHLFEIFEGPPAQTACMTNSVCQIHSDCPQRQGWYLVQRKISQVLSEISLFDLMWS